MATTIIRLGTIRVTKNIEQMLEEIIENHDLAKQAIINVSQDDAIKVIEKNKSINTKYYEIESELAFMITKAPLDKELRRVLASLHIIKELERIATYAKNIAKFFIVTKEVVNSSINRINKIHELFRKMLIDVIEVIKTESVEKSLECTKINEEIKELMFKITNKLITSVTLKSKEKDVKQRLFVFNVINALERAADHIVSICDLIVYISTGQHNI